MIQLTPVTPAQKELLWNIHQKYLYEMTNYYDDVMDRRGILHYGYFDAYFTDPRRTALLIYSDGVLVGFAMIHPYSYFDGHPDHVLAEFTIFPMYRKRRLATAAARRILARYSGRWEIKYNENNAAARALWTRITAPFRPEKHSYSTDETVLCFSTASTGVNPAPSSS